jgi:hypothetical protein
MGIFGKGKKEKQEQEDALELASYQAKSEFMERILGKEHDMVRHSIIPFAVGGGLDLYFYPGFMGGTAIGTKELVDRDFGGPANKLFDCYELVMCAKSAIDLASAAEEVPPKGSFGHEQREIHGMLNILGRYAPQAKLNPYDTLEFPAEMQGVGGKCLIIDALCEPFADEKTKAKKFGLMLVMEIHRDEMEYAMKQRGKELIAKLKAKGHYPFTGIERESVLV